MDDNPKSLIATIRQIREDTLNGYFESAIKDLKAKVMANPLDTIFIIYDGCISEEMTKYLAHKLTLKGVSVVPASTNQLGTHDYGLVIKIPYDYI